MSQKPPDKKEVILRTGSKEHLKEPFLARLRENGFTHISCDEVGIDRATVYRWRHEDEDFSYKFNECRSRNVEKLTRIAMARAATKSDLLMIFLLKALDPETFKERFSHELDIKTINILVSQFIGAVKKHAHESCPFCKSHLGLPDKIAKELEHLSESLAGPR